MTNSVFLSQAALLSKLKQALDVRSLDGVAEVAPKINWIGQWRRDVEAGDLSESLLAHLYGPGGHPESAILQKRQAEFFEQAVDVMARHGYRVLDDTALFEMCTEATHLLPGLARVCAKHNLRGSEMDTLLHIASHGIPYRHVLARCICAGTDLNAQDENGDTVLHRIWGEALGEHFSTECPDEWVGSTEMLMGRGADLSIVNAQGLSVQALITLASGHESFAEYQSDLEAILMEAGPAALTAPWTKPASRPTA